MADESQRWTPTLPVEVERSRSGSRGPGSSHGGVGRNRVLYRCGRKVSESGLRPSVRTGEGV